MCMIRTQLYLPEELYTRLKLMAKREKKPTAQLIREKLHAGILRDEKKQPTAGEALLGLAELGKKLNIHLEPDFSSKIDDYLYGEEKPDHR